MPDRCPLYYWAEAALLLSHRHPSGRAPLMVEALPRAEDETDEADEADEADPPLGGATLRLCHAPPCRPSRSLADSALHVGHAAARGRSSAAGGGTRLVELAPAASVTALLDALRPTEGARVLHLEHPHRLALPPSAGFVAERALGAHGRNAVPNRLAPLVPWCTACAVTRRGGMVGELNTTADRLELEDFCKTEARAALGIEPPIAAQQGAVRTHTLPRSFACCDEGKACRECTEQERPLLNLSRVPESARRWLPLWAQLRLSRVRNTAGRGVASPAWPRCAHPLCTGADRQRFP